MEEKKLIMSKEEYLNYFNDENVEVEKIKDLQSRQYEALKNALDIRKFEIELYWKRAAYFWAFIAASFAGYFTLVATNHKESLVLVSLLGFIFSYSWYFVNRGSKFWQNNWERHVDYLEGEVMGPLYKIVSNPYECSIFNPVSEYPMSVSKINQILSLIISLIWLYLIYDSMGQTFGDLRVMEKMFIELVIVAIITFIYLHFGKSSLVNKKNKKDKKDNAKFIIRDIE